VAQISDTPSATLGAAGGDTTPTPISGGKTSTPTAIGGAGGLATKTPTPLVGGLATSTPTPILPGTGFADDAGVWGLVFLGLGLIAVVVIVRRVRMSLR